MTPNNGLVLNFRRLRGFTEHNLKRIGNTDIQWLLALILMFCMLTGTPSHPENDSS